jgi:hypothetical protein
MRAFGAAVPVSASVRVVIPVGAVMAERPLAVNAPTRSFGAAVVVTAAVRPFEFLVIAPALACTGWTRSTPEYARIDPTAPVGGAGPVNVYVVGSAAPATRTNNACASGLEGVVHSVRTTVVQPLGAEMEADEAERKAIAATRTLPAPALAGRSMVNDCAGVAVAALVADANVGVAAEAPPEPSKPPPSATAAAATVKRRPVILGTKRL